MFYCRYVFSDDSEDLSQRDTYTYMCGQKVFWIWFYRDRYWEKKTIIFSS